jgi:heptosyltransferase-1
LIVRLSAIGDVVFASPLIHALRQRYPEASISWLVQPDCRTLLECHPELDEVIVWPRAEWAGLVKQRRWLELWRSVRGFRSHLRSYNFDLVLDVQGLLKSGFLAWLSGARQRIGLGSREGSQWLMSRVVEKGGDSRRIGSEYLHLASVLGLPTRDFEMHVGLCDNDRLYARELITARGLAGGYLVFCPFTTRAQKHWFEESWRSLLGEVQRTWGLPVLLLGGPGDRDAAESIAAGLSGVINLAGETSLRQAASLIAHAELVIGVDTGLTHMGIAMGRPTLCLFGSTRPYLDTGHDNAYVIYHELSCSPCRRNPTCNGRFDCMQAISVEEVMAEAEGLPGFREAGR